MRKGSILIFLGLALMLSAAGLTAFNHRESQAAGEAAANDLVLLLEAQPQPQGPGMEIPDQSPLMEAYLPEPEMEMPVVEIDGREYVGTLDMPSIDRNLPVLNGWDDELLQISPCRYRGSAYTGNLILMAHNNDSHFGRLKKLCIGDLVAFRDMDGNLFTYEVAAMETLNPQDTDKMEEGDWDLTLFTCTTGGQTRVTVRCTLVSALMMD